MYDFELVHATSKDEQIRAWSVTKAIDSLEPPFTSEVLINRSAEIEEYILNGMDD